MSANKVKKAVKFEESPSPQGYSAVGSIIIYAHVDKEIKYKPNSTNLKDQVDTIIEQPNQEEEDDDDDSSSNESSFHSEHSEGLDDVEDDLVAEKFG